MNMEARRLHERRAMPEQPVESTSDADDVTKALRDAYDILTRTNDQPDHNATLRLIEAAIRQQERRSLAEVVIGHALPILDAVTKELLLARRDAANEGNGETSDDAVGKYESAIASMGMAIGHLDAAIGCLKTASGELNAGRRDRRETRRRAA
jgi:hypothetical protein